MAMIGEKKIHRKSVAAMAATAATVPTPLVGTSVHTVRKHLCTLYAQCAVQVFTVLHYLIQMSSVLHGLLQGLVEGSAMIKIKIY